MFKNSCNLPDYIELYREQKIEMLSDGSLEESIEPEHKAVAVTFRIAIDAIENKAPAAIKILYFISLINKRNIPYRALKLIYNNDLHTFLKIKKAIMGNSLVFFDEQKELGHIHGLVQEIIKHRLKKDEVLYRQYLHDFVRILNTITKDVLDLSKKAFHRDLIENNILEHLLRFFSEEYFTYNTIDDYSAFLLAVLGNCLLYSGDSHHAVAYLKKSLTYYESLPSLNNEQTHTLCRVMNDYGLSLHLSGKSSVKSDEVEKVLSRCIEIKRTLFPLEPIEHFINEYENLAICLRARGEPVKALELIKKVNEYRKTHGIRTLDYANTLDIYGTTLYYSSKVDESIECLNEALDIIKHIYGKLEHPEAIYILAHKGNAYLCGKRIDEAMIAHKKSVEIIREFKLEKNLRSIAGLNAYANLLAVKRKYQEAITLYTEMLSYTEEMNHCSLRTIEIRANLLCCLFLNNDLLDIEGDLHQFAISNIEKLYSDPIAVYSADEKGKLILEIAILFNAFDRNIDEQLVLNIFLFTHQLFSLIAGEKHFFTALALERLEEMKIRLNHEQIQASIDDLIDRKRPRDIWESQSALSLYSDADETLITIKSEKKILHSILNGNAIVFERHETLGDGSCGFYALPIPGDRDGAKEILLAAKDNEAIRAMVAIEMREAVVSKQLQENLLNNDFYREWLFTYERLNIDTSISDLQREEHMNILVQYTTSKIAYVDFITYDTGKRGRLSFNTYETGSTVLDALAQLSHLRIHIFHETGLMVSIGHEEDTPVYLYHYSGQDTHFELMSIISHTSVDDFSTQKSLVSSNNSGEKDESTLMSSKFISSSTNEYRHLIKELLEYHYDFSMTENANFLTVTCNNAPIEEDSTLLRQARISFQSFLSSTLPKEKISFDNSEHNKFTVTGHYDAQGLAHRTLEDISKKHEEETGEVICRMS